jgi:flagellar biosynthesis protein FliP
VGFLKNSIASMVEKLGKIRTRKKIKINNDIYVEINVIIEIYDGNELNYVFNIGIFVVVVVFVASVVVAVSQELPLRLN